MTLPALMRRDELAGIQDRAMRTRGFQLTQAHRERRIALWLPLTPLFWLLSPFAILLAPLLVLAPPLRGMNSYAAVVAIGRVLTSIGGTVIQVDAHDARIRIRIL